MSIWKKIGWTLLGCCPVIIAFFWQIVASIVSMGIYMIQKMVEIGGNGLTPEELNLLSQQLSSDFLNDSHAYSLLMFIVYVGYLVIFSLWYYFMFLRKHKSDDWKQVLKPHRVLGIVACGFFLQISLSMLLSVILPMLPKLYDSYMQIMGMLGDETIFMVLCVCLLAPIGEELIFRGLTLRIMRKVFPWQVAVLIQGILFGVYHLNLVQGVYATLMGLILGYIAYRYGSVLPGILLHISINSLSYVTEYLFPSSLEGHTGIMLGIGIVTLVVAIGFLTLITKQVAPKTRQTVENENIQAN